MVLVTGIAQCFSSEVAHVLVGYVPTQALSTSYVSLLSASRHMQEVSFAPSPWRQLRQRSTQQDEKTPTARFKMLSAPLDDGAQLSQTRYLRPHRQLALENKTLTFFLLRKPALELS
uniref:Uncharacterized protein n=1 Tax=Anopheles coluzzii TaxID=1518534 RepID=A0A8W7PF95_ANOCL